ncbi:MAG TPA: sugar phosphate isomerase/epimerase family protein [Candidatus Hydrogenedentes bacterium]|nr:sugar phosphate isomerase/epimerase family protein [Candidatus Hydrogenedentota bacterium]HPG67435.1 sugar phosphate isomerase/epimerase family protein [Candidatus Hydrogenedentota bacterium]
MKLGMVTYNMGKDMNCAQLIALCRAAGLDGVELRTTHPHGVEIGLSAAQRAEVKRLFADGGVEIVGLGSAFEYHSPDPDVVRRNVEESKAYAQLAADVGAPGIKVRPNGLPAGVPVEKTQEQIGLALRDVAAFAADRGIEVRLEVHGPGSSCDPKNIRAIMDHADHPNALVCWNSNTGEQDEHGSIQANFDLLKHKIALVHITDIGVYQYPWQQLFDLLKGIGYDGYCLAEIQYNDQPERFMKYYRTLFDLYTGDYRYPQPSK